MGHATKIRTLLENKLYDLHGLKLTYSKALESGDRRKAEALRMQILILKEEIHTLSAMLGFQGVDRN